MSAVTGQLPGAILDGVATDGGAALDAAANGDARAFGSSAAGVIGTILLRRGGAANRGASSAKQGANLKEHLRQTEKYGQGGVKELQNGKIRYSGNISPANKPGEMAGRRTVREWDPATGNKRTWHETVDHNGNVRIVRPQRTDNVKTHYQFDADGNYTGKF